MAYRIIIIDDEKEISGGFAMFFPWKMLGYRVAGQFDNSLAALDFLRQNEIDVVCLDVKMPGKDGLALAEEIRNTPLLHQPALVFFSAFDEFKYAQKAMEYGAMKYILKSTPYEELIEIFQDLREKLDAGKRGNENPGRQDMGTEKEESKKEPEENKILSIMKDYIEAHLEDVNLERLSEMVYMSPAYVSRYFKQETGQNFQDYLIERRMEKASRLLSDIRYRVGEVSELVGYRNPFNFTRTFKKYFGETPRDYRYRMLGRRDGYADEREDG
ncbi:MAG: response regulator [Lachnospiraceae bacterium]|nr:response regulator [Lachnospiraceae bacterium]